MTSTPTKKPADHKKPAAELHDAALEREELLAGMPELKPAHRLRIRDRNRIASIIFKSPLFERERQGGDDMSAEDIDAMLELAAQIDEFAESIAVDADAYAEWAAGKDHQTFFAILDVYASAVGESNSSAS
jgi:hypothetical protein